VNKSRVDEKNLADIYGQMLNEDMSTGDGVFGNFAGHDGDVGNTDFYATDDNRIPYTLGVQTRNGKLKTKKKGKKKRTKTTK
jgi:hypothetical protein